MPKASLSLQPRGILVRGSFAQLFSIEKMGNGVVNSWTICNTSTDFCTTFHVFTPVQEPDNWTISAMDVPGHVVFGRDLGETAILCPRQV